MKRNLTLERRSLELAWAHYNEGGRTRLAGESARVQGAIVQSWQRSSRTVSPQRPYAPVDDPEATLQEWRQSLLHAASRPMLQEICDSAEAQDFIVGICDASGKLLWTHSSRHMQRRAESLHFVPGGHWHEGAVGTNALALALQRSAPAQVFSAEHYLEAVHDWVCYSAPIRDPTSGLALGVLDFSTTWQNHNPLGLLTATALAKYIEERLQRLSGVPLPGSARGSLPAARLQLYVCGPPRVVLDGKDVQLSPRRLELLTLLALNPQGLNLESLHVQLYGDAQVSPSTLKAEISGLRQQLGGGVASRPYRLTLPYRSDAQLIEACLQTGRLTEAAAFYQGPLLGFSQSPTLSEWRHYLERALQGACFSAKDAEVLWQLVCQDPQNLGADPETLERLEPLLPAGDSRRALIAARLLLLRS